MTAGETLPEAHGKDLAERYETSIERMIELGEPEPAGSGQPTV